MQGGPVSKQQKTKQTKQKHTIKSVDLMDKFLVNFVFISDVFI